MNKIGIKQIEIFCGTGGVGKTTLATSRALYLASISKKILIITVDPAKRLKEILKISDNNAGKIQTVNGEIFSNQFQNIYFDAMLISPQASLERIEQKSNNKTDFNNKIIQTLVRPYGGMNEIMGIVDVHHFYNLKKYDVIILDTPPGKHFIDFLKSAKKINAFFDKGFIEIFSYLGKSLKDIGEKGNRNIFKLIISSGVKKLLKYLEIVTGPEFVKNFTDAIHSLYLAQEAFIEALQFEEVLQDQKRSNWFLVTSAQQYKAEEAEALHSEAITLMHKDNYLLINKSLTPHLIQWDIATTPELSSLKECLLGREQSIKNFVSNQFQSILEFPEVLGSTPQEHVTELAEVWKKD